MRTRNPWPGIQHYQVGVGTRTRMEQVPYLIVSGAACVQLAAHRANQLDEAALVRSMDVLITLLDLQRAERT